MNKSNDKTFYAIRLFGFTPREIAIFNATFAVETRRDKVYFCLTDTNVQAPDLYLADAGNLVALAALNNLNPSPVRPALLVGTPDVGLPYRSVVKPLRWKQLFVALDELIDQRERLLDSSHAAFFNDAAFGAGKSERRRVSRIDLDLTDPDEYTRMRAVTPVINRILVVDQGSRLKDRITRTFSPYGVFVDWASTVPGAMDACRDIPMSLVVIRQPDDPAAAVPYDLCTALKQLHRDTRTAVIIAVDERQHYQEKAAIEGGSDGYIRTDLSAEHLFLSLSKFLQFDSEVRDRMERHAYQETRSKLRSRSVPDQRQS